MNPISPLTKTEQQQREELLAAGESKLLAQLAATLEASSELLRIDAETLFSEYGNDRSQRCPERMSAIHAVDLFRKLLVQHFPEAWCESAIHDPVGLFDREQLRVELRSRVSQRLASVFANSSIPLKPVAGESEAIDA